MKFRYNEKTGKLQYMDVISTSRKWVDCDLEDEENLRWMAEQLTDRGEK